MFVFEINAIITRYIFLIKFLLTTYHYVFLYQQSCHIMPLIYNKVYLSRFFVIVQLLVYSAISYIFYIHTNRICLLVMYNNWFIPYMVNNVMRLFNSKQIKTHCNWSRFYCTYNFYVFYNNYCSTATIWTSRGFLTI